jgi:hypothetical protein
MVEALLPEQFEEEPCEFNWKTVKMNTIVKHRTLGYGIMQGSVYRISPQNGRKLGAEIQFENGVTRRFFGDQYREFTKIGPWTEETLK